MSTQPRAAEQHLRVLVVEDDPAVADALAIGLGHAGHEVEVAESGTRALGAVRADPPDAILLDLMLPGIDGLALCREIRRAGHEAGIIVITARGDMADRIRGLDAGADDYLAKPFHLGEVLARIRAVMRRRRPLPDDAVIRFADIALDPATREVQRGDRPVTLTPREFDLLAYFLRHPRRPLGREELLNAVWGPDFEGSLNVVEVYVAYLRRRLGDPHLLQTVRGIGYAIREPS